MFKRPLNIADDEDQTNIEGSSGLMLLNEVEEPVERDAGSLQLTQNDAAAGLPEQGLAWGAAVGVRAKKEGFGDGILARAHGLLPGRGDRALRSARRGKGDRTRRVQRRA
ncbi:MAG: hypothetical protein EXR76_18810 [Myxococcales bacterium]|nr:hypothetical protein [Myxococcales bacterium]